jgi:hypothetical protein
MPRRNNEYAAKRITRSRETNTTRRATMAETHANVLAKH